MTTQEKIHLIESLESKGLFSFVASTIKESLKKSRLTKLPTPANIEFITTIKVCTVSLGNNYQEAVNNRRLKEGLDPTFVAGDTYCHPISEKRLVYKHNNKDVYYLRVYPNLCHSFKTVIRYYDVNNVHIPEHLYKALEPEYFKLNSDNISQGLNNEVTVYNYSLDNVKHLKRGDIVFSELTAEWINQFVLNKETT